MPTDPAFIRADQAIEQALADGLRQIPGFKYSPLHKRLNVVRAVAATLKALGYSIVKDDPAPSGKIDTATGEVTEGPWDKQLREEADRQYPAGEEG